MKLLFNRESIVCNRVMREYNKFRYYIMKLTKEEIMNKCNKIYFYGCVKEFFLYNALISDEVYLFLISKNNIIHTMWELYLKYEKLGCSTWDKIDEILECWMNG